MYILLPPSEGKNADPGESQFALRQPQLLKDTTPVLRHLMRLKAAERQKFYGVKDVDRARSVHTMNLAVPDSPVLPAVERYTGVVYDHVGFDSLPPKIRKRILIVSGLFGLVSGTDGLPSYKQPINPWLHRYWKPINSARIQSIAQGKPILDLLSQSYQKAIDYPDRIHVEFRVQGGKKTSGHFGKAIKGRFVRFLLENNIDQRTDFAEFTEDGYRYDGANFIQE